MTPWKLRQATKLLDNGGIIAYPTETVYGLGCDPLNFQAVSHLCNIKHRSLDKGLILIASSIEQVLPYVALTRPELSVLTHKHTKPVSWIIPASDTCPVWLRGKHSGIAIRITTHPVAHRLCERSGNPLVSTSANLSQQPAAKNVLSILKTFNGQIDMIIHDACSLQASQSIIKDLITGKIIRSHLQG